jgi:hypothetical protein
MALSGLDAQLQTKRMLHQIFLAQGLQINSFSIILKRETSAPYCPELSEVSVFMLRLT